MATYRWNSDDAARAYDAAAEIIHPHYRAVQQLIVSRLSQFGDSDILLVDLGGGSGLLMDRLLEEYSAARGAVVDQSEPFLATAAERLARFADRVDLVCQPFQGDWPSRLEAAAGAIVSTSAIHHLDPQEKQQLFRRCYEALAPDGIFLNGDEYRPESDDDYRNLLERWAAHMYAALADGRIPAAFAPVVDRWRERNITGLGRPRQSGDDCHETLARQSGYLRAAGFDDVRVVWQRELWAVLTARKCNNASGNPRR